MEAGEEQKEEAVSATSKWFLVILPFFTTSSKKSSFPLYTCVIRVARENLRKKKRPVNDFIPVSNR